MKIVIWLIFIVSLLSMNAQAEKNVTDIFIYSDSYVKSFDAKVEGWASIDFDDSYWVHAKEIGPEGEKAQNVIYPETPSSLPFYYRKTFYLSGNEIMSGMLFDSTPCCVYQTYYVNDNKIDGQDIAQYLRIGKNVIAVITTNPSGQIAFTAKIRMVTDNPSSIQPALTDTPIPKLTSIPTEIFIYSDSYMKSFDAKVEGWASIDFDDSYWVHAKEIGPEGEKAQNVIYPETPSSLPFYYRKTFYLNGNKIMSGMLFDSTPCCVYQTYYVNDNKIDGQDIAQYLRIGKNVIAVITTNPSGQIAFTAKIRMVTDNPSSTQPALTDTPIPTLTSVPNPTPVQTSDSASVSLTGEKTDVIFGEDISLKLSAVNLITKPLMHVQIIIIPPSGMSVTSSEFVKSGTNQFTANYELNPGEGKDIEVKIRPNQIGDFNVNGRIIYYFDDEKDKAEDHKLNLPIKVRERLGSTTNPIPNIITPVSTRTPGFGIIIGIVGVLFAILLKKEKIK